MAFTFDQVADLAISTIVTAPSPTSTGTGLTVAAGEGARFPTAPFDLIAWPTAVTATPANAKKLRVTGLAGDTLTLDRSQDAINVSRTLVAGDQVMAPLTAAGIRAMQAAINSLLPAPAQPNDQPNQTSHVTFRGGQAKVVAERLNAQDGYLAPNSSSDQSAALQNFINAVGSAVGGGGIGLIPNGSYNSNTFPTFPANKMCHIIGENEGSGYPTSTGTILNFPVDVSTPDTQAAITLLSSGDHYIGKMTIQGPGSSGVQGVRPAALAALDLRGSNKAEHLNIYGFGAPVLLGGATRSSDHIKIHDIVSLNCGWGIYQLASNTYGDLKISDCRFVANLAPMACASSSNGFGGVWIHEGGMYGPYSFFRWDDGAYGGTFLAGINHFGCNAEEPAHGFAYDEQWAGGGGVAGAIFNCDFSAGSVQSGTGSGGWQATCSITNIAGNVVTIHDTTGFVVRKNQIASGSGFSGQTVVSFTGTWVGPGNTATYVLTLSGTPTGSPTSVTLTMPTRATIACGSLSKCEFGFSLGGQAGIVAPFVVAPLGIHENRLSDGAAVKSYLDAGQPFVDPASTAGSTSFVFGNKWGSDAPGSPLYTSLQAVSGAVISVNDAVEQIVTANGSRRVQRAQGLGAKVIGIAQQAVASGTPPIDILAGTSGTVGATTQVNNKSTTNTIPSGSRIKPDAANPGGVVVAAAGDVSIGVTTAAISPSSSGPASIDIGTFGVTSGPSGGGGATGKYFGGTVTLSTDVSGAVVVSIVSDLGKSAADGTIYYAPGAVTAGEEVLGHSEDDGTVTVTQLAGQVAS